MHILFFGYFLASISYSTIKQGCDCNVTRFETTNGGMNSCEIQKVSHLITSSDAHIPPQSRLQNFPMCSLKCNPIHLGFLQSTRHKRDNQFKHTWGEDVGFLWGKSVYFRKLYAALLDPLMYREPFPFPLESNKSPFRYRPWWQFLFFFLLLFTGLWWSLLF